MKKLKNILLRLFSPHAATFVLTVPLSIALLVYSFVYEERAEVIAYISYALSAYTLAALCVRTPDIIRFINRIKSENKYVVRLLSDARLKVKLSLYLSLAMNTAYAIFQLGLGFYHASVWFYSLAAYYILLVVMRFSLLRDVRRSEGGGIRRELMRYRFCGVLLLFMNVALGVIVFYITRQGRTFVHHPVTTIAMAAFTFTSMTLAIVNSVKYRRYKSPLYSASKAISLASASVSMLTLEVAMLTAFGEDGDELFRSVMTASTGAAVCIFVLTLAIFMIGHATREMKKLCTEEKKHGQ